jgi:hypothetical protein
VISQLRESVNREVQQLRVQLYRVHGSAYRRSTCETADDSACQIVNCVNVTASGINSLYAILREVICRVTYNQHVTIIIINTFTFRLAYDVRSSHSR